MREFLYNLNIFITKKKIRKKNRERERKDIKKPTRLYKRIIDY